jgi:hypothetical protein
MAQLFFGEWWNEEHKFLSVPMAEDAARAVYDARGEISVVQSESEVATFHPDVNPDFDAEDDGGDPVEWFLYFDLKRSERMPDQPDVALLSFYDFWGNLDAHYRFVLEEDGRLFLAEVNEYEYADATRYHESTEWTSLTTHTFAPDGRSQVVVRQALPDGSTDVSTQEFRGGDFSSHWEPVPAWGEWASITRRDRSQPA